MIALYTTIGIIALVAVFGGIIWFLGRPDKTKPNDTKVEMKSDTYETGKDRKI